MSDDNHTNSSAVSAASAINTEAAKATSSPYTVSIKIVLAAFKCSLDGLSNSEAVARLEQYGRNTLPKVKVPGVGTIFLYQFKSPLI